MSFSSYTPLVTYPGNGSATTFAIPDKFYDTEDIQVYLIDADGQETALVNPTNFSVVVTATDATPPARKNGNVELVVAPATGVTVAVLIWPANDQDQAFEGRPVTPRQNERVHDRHSMRDATLREFFYRGFRAPLNTTPGLRYIVVGAENTIPIFDADGNLIEGPTLGDVTAVADISDSVTALAPFVGDIEVVSDNIAGVQAVEDNLAAILAAPGAADDAEAALAAIVALGTPASVATKAQIRALDTAQFSKAILSTANELGVFDRSESDLSGTLIVQSVLTTGVAGNVYTKAAHGFVNGTCVVVTAAVNGHAVNTRYYIKWLSYDTFSLCATYDDVFNGSVITLTGATNITAQELLDPTEAVWVIKTGDALNGADGAWVRAVFGSIDTAWTGADTTGATTCDEQMRGAFSLMRHFKHMTSRAHHSYKIDGPVMIDASNFRWDGGAQFTKDTAGGQNVMFYAWDAADYNTVYGLRFDGSRSSFAPQNPVSPFLGYVNTGWLFEANEFRNLADAGIVFRNSFRLKVHNNLFEDSYESGLEARWYDDDPRTTAEWNYQPAGYGGLSFKHNVCRNVGRIEDAMTGLVNGCGVTFDAGASVDAQVNNIAVTDNQFYDCLRAVFCENNDAGTPIYGVQVNDNVIVGIAAAPLGDTYSTQAVKMGIGLINVAEFTIVGNMLRNIGNHDPYDSDAAGIVLSSNTRDGIIAGNTIIEDRGAGDYMDYAIQLTLAERVTVVNNSVRGATVVNILIDAACGDIVCKANPGAEGSYSWGNVARYTFRKDNIAASITNNPLLIENITDVDNVLVPATGSMVAIAAKLSEAITAGNISFRPTNAGSVFSALKLDQTDLPSTTTAYKELATWDGSVIAQGARLGCVVTTDGSFTPNGTMDAIIDIYVDFGGKE